jgi:methionine synthase I (cobalamin-dependent)
MASRFELLAGIGINIIGGCCGTGPGHIRKLSASLKTRGESRWKHDVD